MPQQDIENLLIRQFTKKHIVAALGHFSSMVSELQAGGWEQCIAKGGKFVEAALKALWVHVGQVVPPGRHFKADMIMTGLGNLPAGSASDSIRLTIPRACRFVYDIASNRGGRHDADEIDPNEMDASAVVPTSSWVLAEMIRYAQKGAVDMDQAREFVRALSARRYPLIEVIDGRVYFHHGNKSAKDIALMALAYRYPKRMNQGELIATVQRHGFTPNNAHVAVTRLRRYVDLDGNGDMRLLAPGLKNAEQLLSEPE